MAPSASPSAKKIPTIQPVAERSHVQSAGGAVPTVGPATGLAWPASIPPPMLALEIARGRCEPPPELEAATERLRRSLTFLETAALHTPESSEEFDVLCACAATRWRVIACLALRPAGESPTDAAAFETLLHEVDQTLASLANLERHADDDVQEACAAARASLAKDVQNLLGGGEGGPAPAVDSAADLKQLRKALAAAAKSEPATRKGLHAIGNTKQKIISGGLALVAIASVGFTASRLLAFERPRPVPILPQAPPNSEVLGNPGSGTVILRSTNGSVLEGEAFDKFKAAAVGRGAHVQLLGPTQALLTSAPLR